MNGTLENDEVIMPMAMFAPADGSDALERVCKLMIGDLLVQLIDGHGLRAIDSARETGYRPAEVGGLMLLRRRRRRLEMPWIARRLNSARGAEEWPPDRGQRL
jgi:hypothetical protein